MRRVSYLFPKTCDIMFDVPEPFSSYLSGIKKLADRQDNFRSETDPVKREITVFIAHDRLGFEKISKTSPLEGEVTNEADMKIVLTDTILRASGNIPVSEHIFLVKGLDKGNFTEIYISKSPVTPGISSFEMKQIIRGLFP